MVVVVDLVVEVVLAGVDGVGGGFVGASVGAEPHVQVSK